MDPLQFLLLAERLLNSEAHPAGYRSAVSRAYYAAHHCLGVVIESTGVTLKRGPEAHADVWNHLAGSADIELMQVGANLARLRSDRNQADYDLSKRHMELAANAEALVALARSLIVAVRSVQGDATRFGRIASAIRARHAVLRGLSKK